MFSQKMKNPFDTTTHESEYCKVYEMIGLVGRDDERNSICVFVPAFYHLTYLTACDTPQEFFETYSGQTDHKGNPLNKKIQSATEQHKNEVFKGIWAIQARNPNHQDNLIRLVFRTMSSLNFIRRIIQQDENMSNIEGMTSLTLFSAQTGIYCGTAWDLQNPERFDQISWYGSPTDCYWVRSSSRLSYAGVANPPKILYFHVQEQEHISACCENEDFLLKYEDDPAPLVHFMQKHYPDFILTYCKGYYLPNLPKDVYPWYIAKFEGCRDIVLDLFQLFEQFQIHPPDYDLDILSGSSGTLGCFQIRQIDQHHQLTMSLFYYSMVCMVDPFTVLERGVSLPILTKLIHEGETSYPKKILPNKIIEIRPYRENNEQAGPVKYHPIFSANKKNNAISGGYVFIEEDRTKQVLHNATVLDFESMYPNIILRNNISFDTRASTNYEGDVHLVDITHNGKSITVAYAKDQPGLIPSILKSCLHERTKNKNNPALAKAYKILANAFYGYLGMQRGDFYNASLVQSITQTGVKDLTEARTKAEAMEYDIVYGDSVHGSMETLIRRHGKQPEWISFDTLYKEFKHKMTWNNKERVNIPNMDTWCPIQQHWVPLQQFIAHEVPSKRLCKIRVENEEFIMTKDHQLFGENELLTPQQTGNILTCRIRNIEIK